MINKIIAMAIFFLILSIGSLACSFHYRNKYLGVLGELGLEENLKNKDRRDTY